MNAQAIKSYLVSLGFSVDKTGHADFQKTIKDAGVEVVRLAGTMAKDFVAAGVAVTGVLMSISGATVAMIDNVAQADMSYQLFARRMFMSTDAAKKLKIATDALGYSLEDIVWGPPELRSRYYQLMRDQQSMQGGLGGDFESQMRGIRDVRFEFTRLRVEMQYLAMGTVHSISQLLFGDKDQLLIKMRQANDWLIHNLPYISNQLANYIVPIMKDMWRIGSDIWRILKDVAEVFLRIIGILSGDQALAAGTLSLQSFGMAALHVANALTFVYDKLAAIVDFLTAHPTLGGALLGAVGGGSAGFSVGMLGGPESALIGTGIGAGAGALLGGVGGYLYGNRVGAAQSSMSVAQQAAIEARRIAPSLNIPPSLLLAQWAHETNGFSDYKAGSFHNLGGVRDRSGAYRTFGSFDEFGDYVAKLYRTRDAGVMGSTSVEQYAAALKSGGYYGDTYANYSAGMRNRMPMANQLLGGDTTINVGDINITQPNATPDQIYSTVTRAVREGQSRQVMRNNVQFDGSYY